MRFSTVRVFAVVFVIAAVIGAGFLTFSLLRDEEVPVRQIPETVVDQIPKGPKREVIGESVEKRDIEAFTYGSGNTHIVFVGGVHGGYEWNSVLLAYEFIDYFNAHPEAIPESVKVTVIPSVNPDGVFRVIGKTGRFILSDVPSGVSTAPGRFNAHEVDLNRNFGCKWKPKGTWRGNSVSAGMEPFSEPETRAIRDYALTQTPDAFVFWHSQANAVFASECVNGVLFETRRIMNAYSRASGYPAIDTFEAYEVTGDAEGWLASINIPAITVELSTHEVIEWEKNLAGVKALFEYFRGR